MTTRSKVLIVDDDPGLRKTLCDVLEMKGYAVVAVGTGQVALERVKEEAPVVALIDLKLDDIPGLEVLKETKERSPDTECIVLTGYASQESAIEAVNLGAYGYVQKPYDMEQLLLSIRRAVEKREAEEEARYQKKYFQALFENSPEAVVSTNMERRVTDMNPTFQRMFGYSLDDMKGKDIDDCILPEEKQDSATIDTPKGTARLSATDGVITGACRVNESLLLSLPEVEFPFGVFNFNISNISSGQTVNVSIELPQDLPSDAEYWMYGQTTDNPSPHWYAIPMEICEDNRTVIIQLTDGRIGDDDMMANGEIVVAGAPGVPVIPIFGTKTPANPYPSISGTHTGTITPIRDVNISKLYTYPCSGTGGHTESIELYENNTLIANGTWTGYKGDTQ